MAKRDKNEYERLWSQIPEFDKNAAYLKDPRQDAQEITAKTNEKYSTKISVYTVSAMLRVLNQNGALNTKDRYVTDRGIVTFYGRKPGLDITYYI